MEKTQADAIVKAIMEPDLRAQEELRTKRAQESADLARRRRVAWFTLAGCGIGGVVAYIAGVRISEGIVWGGITCTLAGWTLTHRVAA